MPRFTLLILFVLGCLLAARAHAEDAVIVCTPPTTNTDNTPVTLTAIRLYGAISNTVRQTIPAGQPCRFVESNLTPGVHSWYVTAVSALGESVPSNPVSKTVAETPICGAAPAPQTRQATCPAPTVGNFTQTNAWTSVAAPECWAAAWLPTDPPTGICATPPLVTASTKAYEQVSSTLPLAWRGLVRIGTPCGPETLVRNSVKYCRVPLWRADGAPQVLVVVWPSTDAITDFWVKASP
jgi:hypothetical protein